VEVQQGGGNKRAVEDGTSEELDTDHPGDGLVDMNMESDCSYF